MRNLGSAQRKIISVKRKYWS